jgi:hypothetical protein
MLMNEREEVRDAREEKTRRGEPENADDSRLRARDRGDGTGR